MSSGAVALCELDDDQIQGVAVGPTQGDILVTALEDGVFLRSTVSKEQEQAWALSSIGLELSHAAAWDARTQHFYAVAAVRPVAAKASSAGFRQRLLGWPASFDQPLEEAPISIELHTAVHSVHPIFPTSTADSLSGSGSEAVPVGVGKEQQHHSSSGTEKVSAGAAQKQKAGSVQQNGALLHTMLPPIRTKSKLKPGKQKPADAKTAAQLPWMLDWIATGRTAQDRSLEERHEGASGLTQQPDASTSGRSAAAAGHAEQGIPGVFIVHADGSVALDVAYARHKDKQTNGSADAQTLASAAAAGRLAVVKKGKKRRQSLHLYMLQGNALHQFGEFQLQPPEKGAEVAVVDVSEQRLVLLWSTGVLQSFSYQAAASGQAVLKMRYERKLVGFAEASPGKAKQLVASPTPKKRASAAATTSAQPAKHSSPACILCGDGLLAVAAYVHPTDAASRAASATELPRQKDLLSLANGPVSTPGKTRKGQQAAVLRVTVLEDTYGCVRHVRNLQRADLGADVDASHSASADARQLQLSAQRQGSSITLILGHHSRALLIPLQAEPVKLAAMVGALSLSRQQHPTALQQQALDLQHAQAPVHSHFRPCWAQRGTAIGLPMLPQIGQVAVQVPAEKLTRWQAAAEAVAGDCRAEQEALQQLRQLGSLPSTDVAGALVRDILGRAQAHGADTISQELLQRVAERCAEAGHWEALQLLAQYPQLPALKALQGMLPRLAEQGQFLVLACAFAQAKDVSPTHLGATLSVLLDGASAEMQEGIKQWAAHIAATADAAVRAAEASFGMEGAHESAMARAEAAVMATDGFTAQEVCMHAALAAGHDRAVLQAALRRLQPPQVSSLIAYLLKWVACHPADQESCRAGSLAPGLALPPMEAVLMWACATLDAHFITLAGLPAGAQQALLAVRARIQETLQLSQGVAALSGALEHINTQAPLPALSSANPQQYFVELLDLSVRAT